MTDLKARELTAQMLTGEMSDKSPDRLDDVVSRVQVLSLIRL